MSSLTVGTFGQVPMHLRAKSPSLENDVKLPTGGWIKVRTHAWFINSANPPRDRGKRGRRNPTGK